MKKVTLQELVAHMRRPEDHLFPEFNFGIFNSYIRGGEQPPTVNGVNHCGTSGCIAGNLPALHPDFRFKKSGVLYYKNTEVNVDVLSEYFGISDEAADHLFYPICQRPSRFGGQMLDRTASLEQVLNNFDAFLECYPNGDLV